MEKVLSAGYTELYEEFLAWQKPRVSQKGFISLKNLVVQLLLWLQEQDIDPLCLTVQEALEYKAAVASRVTKEGKPVSAGTCRNLLKGARSVFRFLVASGKRKSNPFIAVGFPRTEERISRNVLTEAQMNALLERLREFTNVENYKTHVVAELLYATGLRIGEAASLKPTDIDTRQRRVHVRQGKGGTPRVAFLTSYAAEVLEHYISRGRELVLGTYRGPRPQGHTLFCVGSPRLIHEMRDTLREACRDLELPVITCHGFRHSLGTHLLRGGCDMRHIQVILGHEKLRTTQIYTQVDKEDVKASLDAHHPRQWKKEGSL